MEYVIRTPAQLGPILKSRRQQRGLTQSSAASTVGLKQPTVSALETDASRSSVETLYKLLSALDLELVLRDKQAESAKRRSTKREW
jgi:HTH-type transcriptional regulator / antitoxin HipB